MPRLRGWKAWKQKSSCNQRKRNQLWHVTKLFFNALLLKGQWYTWCLEGHQMPRPSNTTPIYVSTVIPQDNNVLSCLLLPGPTPGGCTPRKSQCHISPALLQLPSTNLIFSSLCFLPTFCPSFHVSSSVISTDGQSCHPSTPTFWKVKAPYSCITTNQRSYIAYMQNLGTQQLLLSLHTRQELIHALATATCLHISMLGATTGIASPHCLVQQLWPNHSAQQTTHNSSRVGRSYRLMAQRQGDGLHGETSVGKFVTAERG